MSVTRVLILDGYGNFGKRIAASLNQLSKATVIIAGRNLEKAQQRCEELANSAVHAEACIAMGSHYSDLTDDRRCVCDITALNERALNKGLLIVSGASSVPGLCRT